MSMSRPTNISIKNAFFPQFQIEFYTNNQPSSVGTENSASFISSEPDVADALVIIGSYGIPGSGKTFLIKALAQILDEQDDKSFAFFDGSAVITDIVPGGLEVFIMLPEQEKADWRQQAMRIICDTCRKTGKTGVIARHAIFWSEDAAQGDLVCTSVDLRSYTHIIYLNTPITTIMDCCKLNNSKARPVFSITHLSRWQSAEKTALRELCYEHGILFRVLSSAPETTPATLMSLLLDFKAHSEGTNGVLAARALDEILSASSNSSELQSIYVFDADRTLTAEDSGCLFCNRVPSVNQTAIGCGMEYPLKALFGSALG